MLNLPTVMLPEEQVGWMFHRVCMKEASTCELPLQVDRCCKTHRQRRVTRDSSWNGCLEGSIGRHHDSSTQREMCQCGIIKRLKHQACFLWICRRVWHHTALKRIAGPIVPYADMIRNHNNPFWQTRLAQFPFSHRQDSESRSYPSLCDFYIQTNTFLHC